MWPRLLFTTFFLFVSVVVANEWCHPDHDCIDLWRRRVQHTMCVYKKMPSECVEQNGWKHGWTDEERATVLDVHNRLRSEVARGMGDQPPAANMMRLEWDDEAEEIAQRWASQCTIDGHDKCRESWRKEDMGQNYGWAGGSTSSSEAPPRFPNMDYNIRNWVCEEVQNMKQGYIMRYPDNSQMLDIGHYTQVAWATGTRLGCGIAHKAIRNGYMLNWEFKLICNYMVRGNMVGDPVYIIGPPASKCPQGTRPSQTYLGLCEYPRKYKDFSDKLDKQVNNPTTTPTQGKPTEQPKPQGLKPVTPQITKTNSKTTPKPAASWSSWLNLDLSQLPLIGRFFEPLPKPAGKPTNTPPKPTQNNESQFKPGSPPSPVGLGSQGQSQSTPSQPGNIPPVKSSESICNYPRANKAGGTMGPLLTYTMREPIEEDFGQRIEFPMMHQNSDTFNPFADMQQRHEEFRRRAFENHNEFVQRVNAMRGGQLPDLTDRPFFRHAYSRKK